MPYIDLHLFHKQRWNMRKLIIGLAIVLFLTISAIPLGCTGGVYSFDNFIDDLLDAGASVQIRGEINLGFFSIQGRTVMVNGELTNVFEYDNAALADKDVAIVHPDGGGMDAITEEGGKSVLFSWVGQPHFYNKGRLIVVYVDVSSGSDPSTRNLLENILGSQFAGAP